MSPKAGSTVPFSGSAATAATPRPTVSIIASWNGSPLGRGPATGRPGHRSSSRPCSKSTSRSASDRLHTATAREPVLSTVDRIARAAAHRPLRLGEFQVDAHVLPYPLMAPLADDSEETYAALAERYAYSPPPVGKRWFPRRP